MKNKLLIGLLVAPFVLAGCGQKKVESFEIDKHDVTLTKGDKGEKVTIKPQPALKGIENRIKFSSSAEGWNNSLSITLLTVESEATEYSYMFTAASDATLNKIDVSVTVQDVADSQNIKVTIQ